MAGQDARGIVDIQIEINSQDLDASLRIFLVMSIFQVRIITDGTGRVNTVRVSFLIKNATLLDKSREFRTLI